VLPCAQEFPGAPEREVRFGDLETVVGAAEDLEAALGRGSCPIA
jgi:hypothetical protein